MLPVILFSFAYGILSTYLAIYGRTEVGITDGTGLFFVIMACGLVMSRLRVGMMLNRGLVAQSILLGMTIILLGFGIFVIFRQPIGFYSAAFVLGLGFGTMCSALQAMFINLAPNSRRATANATYLTGWDVGIGCGMLLGGWLSERSFALCYAVGAVLVVLALVWFVARVTPHFNKHKLR